MGGASREDPRVSTLPERPRLPPGVGSSQELTRPGGRADARAPRPRIGWARPEIPGYQILDPLGEGGGSVVYRALAPPWGEPRALKVIRSRQSKAARRFLGEIEAARRVSHPNLVRVLDHGTTSAGALFLAMELLEGADLASLLEGGRIAPEVVIDFGQQAAAGLAALHAQGLVHRDVKPGNVFACSDGTLKVLDFGLVVSLGETDVTRLTSMNCIAGTVSYMAPEQVRGDRDEDVRTDVWGLGATLYHALAGRSPFPAGNLGLQLDRVCTSAPDPLPPSVPAELAKVVLRALHKAREARWSSMAELSAALRSC